MKVFNKRISLRMAAAAMALLLGAAAMTACGQENNGDGQDTAETTASSVLDPNNPNLINGTEKIASDPFIYTEQDLTPYITLGEYKGLTVTREKVELTEDELEEQIRYILEYYAETEQITDRAAAEGDTCNFDYSGYLDGEQFDGGTAAGASITLNDNSGFIDGFVPAIIGKMPGESFDIETTFPENYHNTDLAGKAVVFKCTLNYIEGETTVPAFDDAFAQKISDFETAEELRADIRLSVEESKAAQAESQLYNDLWSQVMENATIHQYPEDKVTYIYQQFVLEYNTAGAIYYGVGYEEFLALQNITDAQVQEDARNLVKEDLVFYSIVKAENIVLTDEEYQSGLELYANYYGYTTEEMLEQYGEASIRDGLLWDKTQDMIFSWANIVDAE